MVKLCSLRFGLFCLMFSFFICLPGAVFLFAFGYAPEAFKEQVQYSIL
jgi:hypothetical protein